MGAEFVALSLPPMIIGALAALACALPGNFLLLRKQALLSDAISHVVLPGIVLAYLVTGGLGSGAMLLGAGAAALLAVLLIEGIRRFAGIETGAAMGIVFTTLFALGVLMLEQTDTSAVHLDVEHALMGNLESLIWLQAEGWASLFDPAAWAGLPVEMGRLALAFALICGGMILFWRPLALSSFDPDFARGLGLPVGLISLGLTLTAALAAVAAFDAVGAILVIAMFICPPATARLLTDDLGRQVWLSAAIAVVIAVGGYVLAGYGPIWLGYDHSLSAAGMIATLSGFVLGLAAGFGPKRKPRTG